MSTANASRRVPQEQIERARSVDLVHFLTQHLPPGELKRISSQWTLRSHDSMRISADGRWNWFSQGVGGGDAISYLQSVENMSFIDAVQMLSGGNYISLTDAAVQNKPAERKPFELPPQNTESRRVFAYLRSRGIDGEIIKHCLQSGILYEDAKYHNAVFIGNDKTGQAKYAMLRGTVTGSTFKMEQTGSDKSCGFCMRGSGSTLFVCEAAIDALSVATLRKLGGRDWQRDSYLSIGGATKSAEKLPAALERQLEDFSFNRVVLCLDNDDIGRTATRNIFRMLTERFPEKLEIKHCTPSEKDFNEQLLVKQQNGEKPSSRAPREDALAR